MCITVAVDNAEPGTELPPQGTVFPSARLAEVSLPNLVRTTLARPAGRTRVEQELSRFEGRRAGVEGLPRARKADGERRGVPRSQRVIERIESNLEAWAAPRPECPAVPDPSEAREAPLDLAGRCRSQRPDRPDPVERSRRVVELDKAVAPGKTYISETKPTNRDHPKKIDGAESRRIPLRRPSIRFASRPVTTNRVRGKGLRRRRCRGKLLGRPARPGSRGRVLRGTRREESPGFAGCCPG